MKKNHLIEFWRFVASLIIAGFHGAVIFRTGWIFVEFFFMLTGYFAFKHLMEKPDSIKEPEHFPIKYTLKKMVRILPYSTIAILIIYIRQVTAYKLSFSDSIKYALYILESLLLVNGTGTIPRVFGLREDIAINYMPLPSLWYLTVIIVALPVMMYLVYYLYKKLGLGLVGLFPILIYGYLIMKDGSINGWHEDLGFYFSLCNRGLAGMLLGGLIYYIADLLKNAKLTSLKKSMLLIVEICFMLGVIGIATLKFPLYELLSVILLIGSLSITLSGVTATSKVHFTPIEYLGKLSLPIYCMHPVIQYIFGTDNVLKYYGLTILSSIIVLVIVEGIRKIRTRKTNEQA